MRPTRRQPRRLSARRWAEAMHITIMILLLSAGKDATPAVSPASANLEHAEARAEIQPSGISTEGAQVRVRNQTYDLVSVPVTGGGLEDLLVHRQQDLVRNTQLEGFEQKELAAEVWQVHGVVKKFRFRLKEKASASTIDERNGLLVASSFGCCDATDAHAVYSLGSGRRLFFAGGDVEPYVFPLVWENRFRAQFVGVHVSGSDRDKEIYDKSPLPGRKRRVLVSLASQAELTDQLQISFDDGDYSPPLESVGWFRTEPAKGDKHEFHLWPPKDSSPPPLPQIVIKTASGDKIEIPIEGDHFIIGKALPANIVVRRIQVAR